jgi:hypothetical protein
MDGSITSVFLATLNGGAGFAEHTDWRIPNHLELESLLDLGSNTIAAYPEFNSGCVAGCTVLTCSCTAASNYWTSTTYHASPIFAWYTALDYTANSAGYFKTEPLYVRAVRNAP